MSYSFSENRRGEEHLTKILKEMKTMYVKVGFPSGKEPGEPTKGSESESKTMADIALIAATQEFGTTRAGRGNSVTIPSRPFMRPALVTNKEKLAKLQKKLSSEIMSGERTVENGLELIGEFMVSKIKRAINDVETPPLAMSTIKGKGSEKPLINTGQMRNSVTYIVSDITKAEPETVKI